MGVVVLVLSVLMVRAPEAAAMAAQVRHRQLTEPQPLAQAVEADLASLATQATGEMAGFMAAQVAAVAQVLTMLETLALVETEQMALLL